MWLRCVKLHGWTPRDYPQALDARCAHWRLNSSVFLPEPEKCIIGLVTVLQTFKGKFRPIVDLDLYFALEAV